MGVDTLHEGDAKDNNNNNNNNKVITTTCLESTA
jgi:hypothetical protein